MPRRSKGARLQLKAERRDRSGNVTHRATWIIRDGRRDIFTGCAADEIGTAEQKLTQYLAAKYSPRRKVQDIEAIPIGDVLSIFVDDRREHQRNKKGFDGRIGRLNVWWGAKMLSEVTGENCRAYEKARGRPGGAGAISRISGLRSTITPRRACTAAWCAWRSRRRASRGTAG